MIILVVKCENNWNKFNLVNGGRWPKVHIQSTVYNSGSGLLHTGHTVVRVVVFVYIHIGAQDRICQVQVGPSVGGRVAGHSVAVHVHRHLFLLWPHADAKRKRNISLSDHIHWLWEHSRVNQVGSEHTVRFGGSLSHSARSQEGKLGNYENTHVRVDHHRHWHIYHGAGHSGVLCVRLRRLAHRFFHADDLFRHRTVHWHTSHGAQWSQ